jgi:phosphoenolpyruvate carboxylase
MNFHDIIRKGFPTRRNVKETLEGDPEAYYDSAELLEPLKLMYRSLMETHDDGIANGRLLDVIRQARPPPLEPVCSCSDAF